MNENTVMSVIQMLHNVGGVLFAGGPAYLLALYFLQRRNKQSFSFLENELLLGSIFFLTHLWMALLILQGFTGGLFGLTSLYFQGELPTIAPIALVSLSVKVVGTGLAFGASWYLGRHLLPEIRMTLEAQRREGGNEGELETLEKKLLLTLLLLFGLALTVLGGAAFLRWNM